MVPPTINLPLPSGEEFHLLLHWLIHGDDVLLRAGLKTPATAARNAGANSVIASSTNPLMTARSRGLELARRFLALLADAGRIGCREELYEHLAPWLVRYWVKTELYENEGFRKGRVPESMAFQGAAHARRCGRATMALEICEVWSSGDVCAQGALLRRVEKERTKRVKEWEAVEGEVAEIKLSAERESERRGIIKAERERMEAERVQVAELVMAASRAAEEDASASKVQAAAAAKQNKAVRKPVMTVITQPDPPIRRESNRPPQGILKYPKPSLNLDDSLKPKFDALRSTQKVCRSPPSPVPPIRNQSRNYRTAGLNKPLQTASDIAAARGARKRSVDSAIDSAVSVTSPPRRGANDLTSPDLSAEFSDTDSELSEEDLDEVEAYHASSRDNPPPSPSVYSIHTVKSPMTPRTPRSVPWGDNPRGSARYSRANPRPRSVVASSLQAGGFKQNFFDYLYDVPGGADDVPPSPSVYSIHTVFSPATPVAPMLLPAPPARQQPPIGAREVRRAFVAPPTVYTRPATFIRTSLDSPRISTPEPDAVSHATTPTPFTVSQPHRSTDTRPASPPSLHRVKSDPPHNKSASRSILPPAKAPTVGHHHNRVEFLYGNLDGHLIDKKAAVDDDGLFNDYGTVEDEVDVAKRGARRASRRRAAATTRPATSGNDDANSAGVPPSSGETKSPFSFFSPSPFSPAHSAPPTSSPSTASTSPRSNMERTLASAVLVFGQWCAERSVRGPYDAVLPILRASARALMEARAEDNKGDRKNEKRGGVGPGVFAGLGDDSDVEDEDEDEEEGDTVEAVAEGKVLTDLGSTKAETRRTSSLSKFFRRVGTVMKGSGGGNALSRRFSADNLAGAVARASPAPIPTGVADVEFEEDKVDGEVAVANVVIVRDREGRIVHSVVYPKRVDGM
ncbi:hypothetical protein HK101_005467 [Irineochytrium annulatum]|nr:hypothetical protein HK101_005467 [Irineochytrium annulatum]